MDEWMRCGLGGFMSGVIAAPVLCMCDTGATSGAGLSLGFIKPSPDSNQWSGRYYQRGTIVGQFVDIS